MDDQQSPIETQQSPIETLIETLNLKKNTGYPFASPCNSFDPLAYGGNVSADKRNFDSYEVTRMRHLNEVVALNKSYSQFIPQYEHYQLRHLVSADRENVYYRHSPCVVNRFDPEEMEATETINEPSLLAITTLSAKHQLLVAGSRIGLCVLRALRADGGTYMASVVSEEHESKLATNHVHSCISRSGMLQAIFCSNDGSVRALDVETKQWESHHFLYPVNCAASSPDGHARVLVYDRETPNIVDRDGEVIAELPGHLRSGFACAWAPDGIKIATAYEDGILQVFDVRNLQTAWEVRRLARIQAEESCIRTLEFSPDTFGTPLLVAAEERNIVHILDSETLETSQTIENVGEISGVSFAEGGQSLYMGNMEKGIFRYNRAYN